MTGIQHLRRDLRDALDASDDLLTDRMMPVQQLQQTVVVGRARVILAHVDLLPDDPLLLLYRLFGEIGGGDKVQQEAQVLFKQPRAVKIVGRHIGGGERVGIGAVLRQKRQRVVPVRQVKHLVLQVVGHAGGGIVLDAVQRKAAVGPAVIGREDRVKARKTFLRENTDPQTVLCGPAV